RKPVGIGRLPQLLDLLQLFLAQLKKTLLKLGIEHLIFLRGRWFQGPTASIAAQCGDLPHRAPPRRSCITTMDALPQTHSREEAAARRLRPVRRLGPSRKADADRSQAAFGGIHRL